MEIKELQSNWDELGREDPLWAILSDPAKKNGKWDLDEFFRTGEEQIADVMNYVESLGIRLARERALDFGCGIGRLTQALGRHFAACWGVDIAPSMIKLADRYNRQGERCKYYVNGAPDLQLFADDSFDFIFTCIVLQHMRPEYSKGYIKEFLRILTPGGVLVFQIPSEQPGSQPVGPAEQGLVAEELPDHAFRARLVPEQPGLTMAPGARIGVRVSVTNLSEVTWPCVQAVPGNRAVALGNHWLDEAGTMQVWDDGRADLPHDLKPGEEVTQYLVVEAPAEPGNYLLELDMVQEEVAWFKTRGSEAARVPVCVAGVCPEGEGGGADQGKLATRIEMYGVPREEILALLAREGGKVIDVRQDFSAGADWTSYQYCVTK